MISEWHDAKVDPPTGWGSYLVLRTDGEMDVAVFYPDMSDEWAQWQARGHKIGPVAFWMELPPKPVIHVHGWINADNEVVSSLDVCLECGAVRDGERATA